MPDGISMRDFARRDRCSETLVRRKVRSGHLPVLADGTIDPAHVGTAWRQRGQNVGAGRAHAAVMRLARLTSEASVAQAHAERDAALRSVSRIEADMRHLLDRVNPALAEAVRYAEQAKEMMFRLRDIGVTIAPRLATMTAAGDIAAVIDREINRVLADTLGDIGTAVRPAGSPPERAAERPAE